ncbi:Protein argonaute 1C [Zea mays]|uniref:Protein argonaute 1C n=1 Tax=Zea mays TaxID=4577 RepID=A0A3L6EL41_MAIZE|nr:Protein argonaute 1C [Zea mays]
MEGPWRGEGLGGGAHPAHRCVRGRVRLVLGPPRVAGPQQDFPLEVRAVGQSVPLEKMVDGGKVRSWICANFACNVQDSVVFGFCHEFALMCQASEMASILDMDFAREPVLKPLYAHPDQVNVIGILPDNNDSLYEFAQVELFEVLEDDKYLLEEQVQALARQLDILFQVKALYYFLTNLNYSSGYETLEHPYWGMIY